MSYSNEERLWALLVHLLSIVSSIIAPLLVYLIFKESAFVRYHALQALLFQIALWCLGAVFVIMSFCLIGIPFLIALIPVQLIWPIYAGVKANFGELYEYPVVGSIARRSVGI
ncbi:MAG: DUF4870 domain-containing protein [Armatimonadetes bacterium]|nr:DUF4870 domain-containing protein [Armatimonadota bacterium]